MANIDVCAGGNASGTSVTFENHHEESCTISGLGTLLSCGNSFSVPAKSGGTAGSLTCSILSSAAKGTYSYTASCCGKKRTNPAIIYQ